MTENKFNLRPKILKTRFVSFNRAKVENPFNLDMARCFSGVVSLNSCTIKHTDDFCSLETFFHVKIK